MRTYSILNTIIQIEEPISVFGGFECETPRDCMPHISLEVQDTSKNNSCYGVQYFTKQESQTIKSIFFSQKDKSQFLYSSEEDYSKLHINRDNKCSEEALFELLAVGFYSYISFKETLLVHASAVECDGEAIVFTASSGVGKTTQAELWNKYRGAKILNGDKVFLKQEEDGIHAWGSPWRGSSPYKCNKSAKLRAIVVLEQAEANSIKKLSVLEAMKCFIPHVFIPCWDSACEQSVLEFLDTVISETDIYLLSCRPDEAAVELLASVIKE